MKSCLEHNQSCSKAIGLLGYIMERQGKHSQAADYYEQAWKMMMVSGGNSNSSSSSADQLSPSTGYKLAYNYWKARKFVEAIDTCQAVLQLQPSYPKIKKDILDKARMGLRMPA